MTFARKRGNPLIRGTTQAGAGSAAFVSVAVAVGLVTQEPASATWKTSAAPVYQFTPGAPSSTVAPSPATARPTPSRSPCFRVESVSVAVGVPVAVQDASSATWKTSAAPVRFFTPGAVATTVAPSAEARTNAPSSAPEPTEPSVRIAVGVAVVAHEVSSAAWKTSSAPLSPPTPGAPRKAVVPSAESARLAPSPAFAKPAPLESVAVGAELVAQPDSLATWNT